MDKKEELLISAHDIFAKKGYKGTNISDITKAINVATGSFYKHYVSKEDIFLEVYKCENTRIRQLVMEQVDWQMPIEIVVESLFSVTSKHLFGNKIMAEWSNPKISKLLHAYYLSEQGKKDNQFHQFLTDVLNKKMKELKIKNRLASQLKRVYEFLYYIDCHITDSDFEGCSEVIRLLTLYFVKGIVSENTVLSTTHEKDFNK
ncbi:MULTISPECIES: TetR/AcrR family transcriptional regulator [unclassified Treponema]|uniref:TetR/AcrR family transcriptional regulator n=1 Tax=unclassified Treponema TaxID=2638727 RepID=UPI0020A612B6|nr:MULTISPECIES: TetR/AcrR family transcriptional regulator [unclassified Treponema]UTC66790.1 TetR/AcrR family transcriptional regulator [Treponema sp. OMZ 789]UTC69523.1 TetR/AcrR family transcriptional regulator [Treponema sp. OMZ 790]UTC72237.1 TetR/AcrR family transcriptional regulator [Treponema sp. OMZ 791]